MAENCSADQNSSSKAIQADESQNIVDLSTIDFLSKKVLSKCFNPNDPRHEATQAYALEVGEAIFYAAKSLQQSTLQIARIYEELNIIDHQLSFHKSHSQLWALTHYIADILPKLTDITDSSISLCLNTLHYQYDREKLDDNLTIISTSKECNNYKLQAQEYSKNNPYNLYSLSDELTEMILTIRATIRDLPSKTEKLLEKLNVDLTILRDNSPENSISPSTSHAARIVDKVERLLKINTYSKSSR
jgi:hypothetical protein